MEKKEGGVQPESLCYLHLELSHGDEPLLWNEVYEEAAESAGKEQTEAMARYREQEREEELRVLRAYGKLKYDAAISRDLLVPADMPLYALHYAIQRAFGWQNSHLHCFRLPVRRFLQVTQGNGARCLELVGTLFASPLMTEAERFWADDYERGSFRSWLRQKYTGPFLPGSPGESPERCLQDRQQIQKECPQLETQTVQELWSMYEEDPNQLLQRLPVGQVLVPEAETAGGQPENLCCTDVLFYEYDYGDGWMVKITAREDAGPLLRQRRVTERELEQARQRAFQEYRPVCLAADGLPVMDDVGGLGGYVRFLRGIHRAEEWSYWARKTAEEGGKKTEIPENIPDNWGYDEDNILDWAWGQGWTGRMSRPEKLL